MYYIEPEMLDEYDVITASSIGELLEQLNTGGRQASTDRKGRWEAVAFTIDLDGQYHVLRRRDTWGCPEPPSRTR